MAQKLNWTFSAQVQGGPKIVTSQNLEIDAYDKIEMVVANDGNGNTVDIQPGGETDVLLLVITSSQYGEDLVYKAKDGGTESSEIPLTAPQIFSGTGAVGLFGVAPKQLVVTNNLADSATIQVLVGRKA